MTETVLLYNTPHHSHRVFADSIGADFYPLLGQDDNPSTNGVARFFEYLRASFHYPTEYDYYLLEGGRALLPAALFKLRHPEKKLILLNADEALINVVDGLDYYSKAEGLIHRASITAVDAVINVGDLLPDYLQRLDLDVPSETVYPCIEQDLYKRLASVSPAVGSQKIVTVGHGKPTIGFDLLVEAFSRVRNSFPDAELHIAGKDHPAEWDDRPGVTVRGWVDDPAEFLATGELSAHPGRAEIFSVATIEAMRAGCPCIVSPMVGAKTVVSEVDDRFIRNATPRAIAEGICWYFSQPIDKRKEYSESVRSVTDQFSEARAADQFRTAFKSLIEEIE